MASGSVPLKRPADDSSSSSRPPIKKVQFELMQLGPISTLEELDIKVIQFQNKKLGQRLEQKHRLEAELRQRIEQLEKRQTQDDAVLNVVNRYWNQLNEDIRVLLQRFDAETADESENENENEATTSFIMQLSTWDKEELDDKLANRVQVSKRAVAKVIQAFDRLMQRNEKITLALKGALNGGQLFNLLQSSPEEYDAPKLDETIRQANIEIQAENRKLQTLNTSLHEKYHTMSLKLSELQDQVTAKDTEAAELRNQIEDLQYELSKVSSRNDKLENHLAEALEKIKAYKQIQSEDKGVERGKTVVTSVSHKKLEELQNHLEEQRELSNNRLLELDKLHQTHCETLKEVEKLKMDLRQLPESLVVETTEYKCLQSHFSVLNNECMQLKTQLEETRHTLRDSENIHLRQIEKMESEELINQKKLRTKMIVLEDALAQTRKEYEMLRIEFEQNLAANEQSGPISREMRQLITSLQNHNSQLKVEVDRYKRKYKEANTEIPKLQKQIEDLQARRGQVDINTEVNEEVVTSSEIKKGVANVVKQDQPEEVQEVEEGNEGDKEKQTSTVTALKKEKPGEVKRPEKDVKKECSMSGVKQENKEQHHPPGNPHARAKVPESEIVRDMKAKLKKALNEQKEMKLLLDMYKGVSKEKRDKVKLMAAEKKTRAELEDIRQQMKKIQESKREDRKKLADEDAIRRIKQLEEQACQLQKQIASQKQAHENCSGHSHFHSMRPGEEEALLNEMEVTGQAFDDMQEQNSRLIQQLREKDDANFKLMSERIIWNQLHKLLKEQIETLDKQIATLTTQVEASNVVVRKLEEKERLLQSALASAEKELTLRQHDMEMHKRKAIESTQSAADLKLHLEKYHAQMKEAQQVVAEKTSALEAEAYKTRRLQEEMAQLRRKAERIKKIELAGTVDEVLMEEIREYKETLTCSSCKVKRKDAVLSKCFHVFCWDCLKTRYETRQRRCPKCNAAFGANDYHRLYLS